VLEQLADGASGLVTSVTSGAKQMTDEIVQQVTDLIEGVIVMIVTSCVIPLLVLVAFLWLGVAGDRYLRSRELSDGSFFERSVQTCQEERAV
jgi:hypothetical protein